MEQNSKEYTGVWIPAEVMESDKLEPLDKLVYAEIAGFNNCYASNAWIANRVKKSEMSARRSIAKLVKHGFVQVIDFDGRKRTLRVLKNGQSACSNMNSLPVQICPHNNKVENKAKNNKGADAQVDDAEKTEYGNHEVNELMALWKSETGIEATSAKANRLAAYNLIRGKGFNEAQKIVRLCGRAMRSKDQYAPVISSFKDLQGRYEKLSKLLAWEKRQNIYTTSPAQIRQAVEDWADQYEPTDEERKANLAKIREMRKKIGI